MRSYFLCMTKTPSARRDYYIFKFLIAVGILKLFLTYFFLCVEHLKSQFFRSSVILSFYLPRSIFQESYTIYQALFHFLEIFILQAVREGRKAEKNGPNYSPSYCLCHLSAIAQPFEIFGTML